MKSALLIIDVQQGLCTGPYAAFAIDPMVDRINALATSARAADTPVIYIQHEECGSPLTFDSAGWQLYERLVPQPKDVRIRKTATDSFYRTTLLDTLRSLNVGQLIVCGLQSEFCVDSTVRGALAHCFPVTLVADGHSSIDNGVLTAAQIIGHHNATLANLGSYGVPVTLAAAADVRFAPA